MRQAAFQSASVSPFAPWSEVLDDHESAVLLRCRDLSVKLGDVRNRVHNLKSHRGSHAGGYARRGRTERGNYHRSGPMDEVQCAGEGAEWHADCWSPRAR